ncbi:MAG: hypothetical protein ABSC77_14720 [Terracidiphilus sp.]
MKEREAVVRAKELKLSNNSVFLNIPYDDHFKRLYIAYICGLIHLGLKPRATIEIPGGRNRLDKILDLIRSCSYSIHDLSRVQVARNLPFTTPRFNMPFELGLAVAATKIDALPDNWFVFESVPRRVSVSLSDLGGTDANIHNGTPGGVMRELGNAFDRQSINERYSVPKVMKTYKTVSSLVGDILRETGGQGLYEAGVFRGLCVAAGRAAGIPQTR